MDLFLPITSRRIVYTNAIDLPRQARDKHRAKGCVFWSVQDDHVGSVTNGLTVREVNFADKDNFLFSTNLQVRNQDSLFPLSFYTENAIILPRQARDKRRECTKNGMLFSLQAVALRQNLWKKVRKRIFLRAVLY